MNEVLFLKSPMVEKLYGGHKIQDSFGIGDPTKKIGEYWVISGHDHGLSVVENGEYKGQTLKDIYLNHRELFANDTHNKFPLLIKINEVTQPVSVQVHPNDAQSNGEGKAECCLFLNVEEGTRIIRGHTAKTREELKQRVENNEWDSLLIRKPIQNDDFIFTPPGVIHGIEGNLLMAEVQQSSDTTYRLYDYDRYVDGKPRQLHVKQALEVTTVPHKEPEAHPVTTEENGNTHIDYIDNDFFKINRYKIDNEVSLDNPTYSCVVVLSGKGTLKIEDTNYPIQAGMGMVITTNAKSYALEGHMDVLISQPGKTK